MLASGVVLGVAAGLAFGGSLRRFALLHIALWPVLAAGVLVRSVAPMLGDLALAAYVAGFIAVAAVAIANWSLDGMPLIAAGSASNLLVVILNGGMPIDPAAAAAAGISIRADGLHVALDANTRAAILADVIPFAPVGHVYSVGDVLLALGGFWLPFSWLRR